MRKEKESRKNSKQPKPRRLKLPEPQEEIVEYFDEEFSSPIDFHSPQSSDFRTLEPESGHPPEDTHVGKGPKGYRRPDEAILDDVVVILTRHGEIDATNIEIQVTKGEVILTGTVPEEKMKFLAKEVIELIPGVKEVNNQLQIPHSEETFI